MTQFLYLAPIGLVQTTLEGEILMINPMSAQLLMPLSCDGELTNLFEALAGIAPDLRQRAQAYPAPNGMVCESLHLVVRSGTPGRIPRTLSLSLMKLDEMMLMAVLSDVSVSVDRDRALRRSQAWIETLIAGISDYALVTLDCDGKVQGWNDSVRRVTGFRADDSVGRAFDIFYPADQLAPGRLRDNLFEARRDGWTLDEGWRQRADGSRFWGSCLLAPLEPVDEPQPGEPAFSLIIRDISDRREAHEALRHAVACDHLTGLANRRAFFEQAEHELLRWQRTPRPLSLILIDADHFKRVNDLHGHSGGDAVLRHLAVALSESSRGMDVVARVGGEEFAILLMGTGGSEALAVAERLCLQIASNPARVGDALIPYTVSAGVAQMENGISDLEAFMERADQALYRAKETGRNRAIRWTDAPVAVA